MPTMHTRKDFGAERQRLRGLCLASSELITELERMWPAKTPDLTASERQVWADIGSRKVVELLVQLRNEAQAEHGPIPSVLKG